MPDVFSVPIFLIVLRESLEASIIVSVLLALVEQITQTSPSQATTLVQTEKEKEKEKERPDGDDKDRSSSAEADVQELATYPADENKMLVKKMRKMVFLGSLSGLAIALCIGAAFLAVWFTSLTDLFAANEEAWEGSFNLVASILIFVMGLTMLRIDKAKAKWRVKLHRAFLSETSPGAAGSHFEPLKLHQRLNPFKQWDRYRARKAAGTEGNGSKWTLFLLPFITVLREGLEAVVFIGGVSLGQKATSIPLAAICGLIVGLGIGYIIYTSSSRVSISIFLVLSTNLLLLVGAGLFSKSVGAYERLKFNKLVGADVEELGNGPGSFDVRGNIWHLNCCNPESSLPADQGWAIFNAILGWSNNGSVGTVLGYIFYWMAAVVALVVMHITEKKQRLRDASAQHA